jgi:hypothetical protein
MLRATVVRKNVDETRSALRLLVDLGIGVVELLGYVIRCLLD